MGENSTWADISFKFTGKRALVTGGGAGIGRAIAIGLVKAGAETYALCKNQKYLDELVAEYPSIHPLCVDLSDWSAARLAVESLPPIDFLVNNAAVFKQSAFVETVPEQFDELYEVNVKAVLNVSQVVVKSLIARSSPGAIVNISSQASLRVLKMSSSYCASKGALDQLTRVMALELGPHKIRVNSVHPTTVKTETARPFWEDESQVGPMIERIPLGRIAEATEIAGPVLFLLSDAASMINGTFLTVDGGFTVW
jgi:L-xylulose reductase